MTPTLIKSYKAEAAISPCRIVKPGAADYGLLQAAAATDANFGVSVENITAATNDMVDVIHHGVANVEYGGTVTRGGPLTADASGRAVAAAPAAGTNNRIIGYALVSAVVGDIGPALVLPQTYQG